MAGGGKGERRAGANEAGVEQGRSGGSKGRAGAEVAREEQERMRRG